MTTKNEALVSIPHANALEMFDVKQVSAFVYKSVSEETRRSYKRVVREFFGFVGNVQPSQVEPAEFYAFAIH